MACPFGDVYKSCNAYSALPKPRQQGIKDHQTKVLHQLCNKTTGTAVKHWLGTTMAYLHPVIWHLRHGSRYWALPNASAPRI